ncbi:hypothetical protein DFH09DRAFT_1346178 [Mycena vulgaris]|nr:hypothetical protein DFH09DRAFT_1346178 [Mycena vulgaris]
MVSYLSGLCAMFYLWFEAFPLVFDGIYHFNQVHGLLLVPKYHIAPCYARATAANTEVAPEIRLEIGLMASIFIPTSVLLFGSSSKASVHWIVSIVGAVLYLLGQSILMYVTSTYPLYAASVLETTYLLCHRQCAPVLFGRTFFMNLGLGPGSVFLPGSSFLMFWLLLKYGHILCGECTGPAARGHCGVAALGCDLSPCALPHPPPLPCAAPPPHGG